MDIRTILCPTDFSGPSRHALDHAIAIARWYSARIVMLHVHHPAGAAVHALVGAAGHYFDDDPSTLADEQHRLASMMSAIESEALERPSTAPGNVAIESRVVSGHAAETIVGCAVSGEADFIVMGTHGAGGLEHLMLGSVTEKVLRRAPCPVLTVPPRAQAASALPFKRILCPIDFSSSSLAGLQLACSFAQEADATLTLLHVIDEPDENALFVARPHDVHGHRTAREQHVLSYLDTLIPDAVREWSSPRLRTAFGVASERILAVAAEEQSDLIVVGVQGRKPLDLMLFGSTTNHVVRRATCPVLTVRE
jgi:nucleotide-binding universal stress UspA family protein